MKAILITLKAREMLAQRYNMEPEDFNDVGYYLIAEFGDNGEFRDQGRLTREALEEAFIIGPPLENGWFQITRRTGQVESQ